MDTLIERCDRCNGQAYVRFTKGDSELFFCGHHTSKLADSLDSSGWIISIDTRNLLAPRVVAKAE